MKIFEEEEFYKPGSKGSKIDVEIHEDCIFITVKDPDIQICNLAGSSAICLTEQQEKGIGLLPLTCKQCINSYKEKKNDKKIFF